MSRPTTLRILHISDLHERASFPGMPAERHALLGWDAEERGYLLGERFESALREVANDGVDLVCLTGDVADWGHPAEYTAAASRIRQILEVVGVPKDRFFAVPGNHDVQRSVSTGAWQATRDWLADSGDGARLGRWFRGFGRVPSGLAATREELLERTGAFWSWFEQVRGDALGPSGPTLLGYRHTLQAGTVAHVGVPVHVIGLDSAWLCGDETDQGRILVTQEQVQAHVRDGASALNGLRIALVHHPLDHLADHHPVRRLLADDVDLLLHGHQHVPVAMAVDEPGARLRLVAAGCLVEGDHGKGWPNGFQLIEVDLARRSHAVHFRKWAKDGRFWAKGSDLYRAAPDGVLRLTEPVADDTEGIRRTRIEATAKVAPSSPRPPLGTESVAVAVRVTLDGSPQPSGSPGVRWKSAVEGALGAVGLRLTADAPRHEVVLTAAHDDSGGDVFTFQVDGADVQIAEMALKASARRVAEAVVARVVGASADEARPVVVRVVTYPGEHRSPYNTTFRLEAPASPAGTTPRQDWLVEPLDLIAATLSRAAPGASLVLIPQCTPATAIRAGAVLKRVAGQGVIVLWGGEDWSMDASEDIEGQLTVDQDGKGAEPRDLLCLLVSISQDVGTGWRGWAEVSTRVSLRALHVRPASGPSQSVLKRPEQAVGWARQIGQWMKENRPPSHSATCIFGATPGPVAVALGRELNAVGRVVLMDWDKERQEYVEAFAFAT